MRAITFLSRRRKRNFRSSGSYPNAYIYTLEIREREKPMNFRQPPCVSHNYSRIIHLRCPRGDAWIFAFLNVNPLKNDALLYVGLILTRSIKQDCRQLFFPLPLWVQKKGGILTNFAVETTINVTVNCIL